MIVPKRKRDPQSQPSSLTESPEDVVVNVPPRLLPYIDEAVDLGLYGSTRSATVVALFESVLRGLVDDSTLKKRRKGEVVKDDIGDLDDD